MNGLDVIDPPATAVEFNGRTIEIRPLKVGQMPAFARAIKPMTGIVERMLADGGAGFTLDAMIEAIAEGGDDLISAVSIASGVSVEELRESTPDSLIVLAGAAWGANRDFLSGRLMSAIRAAMAAAKPATAGTGPTP